MGGFLPFRIGPMPPRQPVTCVGGRLNRRRSVTRFYGDEVRRYIYLDSDYAFHGQNRAIAFAHKDSGNTVYTYRFAMPSVAVERRELNGETIYGAYHAGRHSRPNRLMD